MSLYPEYDVFIGWGFKGRFPSLDFETDFEGWTSTGDQPPALSLSDEQAHQGDLSLKVEFTEFRPFTFDLADHGFDSGRFGAFQFSNPPDVFKFDDAAAGFGDGRFGYAELDDPELLEPRVRYSEFTGLETGRNYTLEAWVFVSGSTPGVRLRIPEAGATPFTGANDEWVRIALEWNAEQSTAELIFELEDPPADGDAVYIDAILLLGQGDDVSCDVLVNRQNARFSYGRDDVRSIATTSPADLGLILRNEDHRYTPGNPGSLLFGKLADGKPVLLRATYDGKQHVLFQGFLTGFTANPEIEDRSVTLEANDLLGRLARGELSTRVFQGVRTGDAINHILDGIDWPEEFRDIDAGATILRFWWAEGNAIDAIKEIVAAEGLPALVTVSPEGYLVYRDRHHRLLRSASLTAQAEFSGGKDGAEPAFSPPLAYDVGWKDIYNQVNEEVASLLPSGLPEVVWESDGPITLLAGESRTISVVGREPFINAVKPVDGIDYQTNAAVSITLDRTSGATAELTLKAESGTVTITDLQVRAHGLSNRGSVKVSKEHADSIEAHGALAWDRSFGQAGVNDVDAIAELLIGRYSEARPTLRFQINNGAGERVTQILSRDLSDRIRVNEPKMWVDGEFHIENMEHNISAGGKLHELTVGAEQTYEQLDGAFTFGVEDLGFGDGVFGRSSVVDADLIFILDQSNLNEGYLAF